MTTPATRRRALLAHASAELYGSDRVFLESVRALAEAGWQVTVTLPAAGPLEDALRRAGARVLRCPSPVLRKAALRPAGLARLLLDTARAVPPMVRLLREIRPELVYVNTVTVPLWLPLARLLGAAVVAHVHEAEEAVPAPVRFALAAPLLAAHRVVVNSLATGAVVVRALPRLRERTRLVYNGVPGPPARPPSPPRHGEPARVLLVGRISPRKGTDTAVRALARLRERGRPVELEVLGSVFPGYEWFERRVRAEAERAGIAGSVRLGGFRDEVWEAYRAADVAIVPSRVEPFGNTAVEAQLAGVPVVVTDAQGLPETVEGGRWGAVVPADDPDALAAAIAAVLDDHPAALARARAAREAARTRFGPRRYRAEILALATEVTGGAPGRSGD
ncbi:glycosyltransferase [Amycolatopsis aidingensis]|uniref:glycosyltransferase n=1 Tax=Amycolatopsis aidingensis TaxID=2842453 RepID=UPI001E2BDD43|nr:glycosyltransferase [Amycolatopsis aidingensis]